MCTSLVDCMATAWAVWKGCAFRACEGFACMQHMLHSCLLHGLAPCRLRRTLQQPHHPCARVSCLQGCIHDQVCHTDVHAHSLIVWFFDGSNWEVKSSRRVVAELLSVWFVQCMPCAGAAATAGCAILSGGAAQQYHCSGQLAVLPANFCYSFEFIGYGTAVHRKRSCLFNLLYFAFIIKASGVHLNIGHDVQG